MMKAAVILALVASAGTLAALPRPGQGVEAFNVVDVDGAPVLFRDSSGYRLDLGSLGPGDVRHFPSAFLLVNEIESAVRLACASVEGPLARMLVIYARIPGKPPVVDMASTAPDPSGVMILYSPERGSTCGETSLELARGDGDPGTANGAKTTFDEDRGVYTLGSRAEPRTGGDSVLIGLLMRPAAWEEEGIVSGLIQFQFDSGMTG